MPEELDNDPAVTRALGRSLALITAVTVITACFSDLYYFPDEHYQVLEFMSLKLGITAPSDMPWEYFAHIRPWMQPFVYTLIARPLLLLGIRDLFFVTFLLRLATGLFSLAALALFARKVLGNQIGRIDWCTCCSGCGILLGSQKKVGCTVYDPDYRQQ